MTRDQSDPRHPSAQPDWALSGRALRRLMRQHHVTIRVLAQRMQIPMTRVRSRRQKGIAEWNIIRDWVQAITGADPGAIPHSIRSPASGQVQAATAARPPAPLRHDAPGDAHGL